MAQRVNATGQFRFDHIPSNADEIRIVYPGYFMRRMYSSNLTKSNAFDGAKLDLGDLKMYRYALVYYNTRDPRIDPLINGSNYPVETGSSDDSFPWAWLVLDSEKIPSWASEFRITPEQRYNQTEVVGTFYCEQRAP